MKRYLLFLWAVAIPAVAADRCVLQDRTVSRSEVEILERTPIRRDVIPYLGNQKKCIVDFRVRIGREWHTAMGEHVWPGHLPADQACAWAVKNAEDAVRDRVGRTQSVSEKILVCKDEPRLDTLKDIQVGTVADVGQFRPHPRYPNRFYHNGVQCRWFIEPVFQSGDIRNFQGIICEIKPNQWIVVDKF